MLSKSVAFDQRVNILLYSLKEETASSGQKVLKQNELLDDREIQFVMNENNERVIREGDIVGYQETIAMDRDFSRKCG